MRRSNDGRSLSAAGLVAAVASTIALCIMGDSLMYSILPLEAVSLGFALPFVGALLSVNRIIRLISNRWAGAAFEKYGSRLPFVASVILGLFTTAVYGIRAGFVVFLLARAAWGIAWSGLRQGGYVSTWAGSPDVRGRLTGLLWGIVRLGSAISVLIGGFLFDHYGFTAAVAVVAGIGIMAIPVALLIPWQVVSEPDSPNPQIAQSADDPPGGWRQITHAAFSFPAHRWLSLSGFFIYMLGGIVVSTTSIFIASRLAGTTDTLAFGLGVATLTGILHATRWMTNLIVAPIAGAFSDRIGKSNTLIALGISMMIAMLAVTVLPASVAVLCFVFILLMDGSLNVVVNAAASTVATHTNRPHIFVAAFATVSDAGSALGPMIAFSILARTQLAVIYLVGGGLLLASLFKYWSADRMERKDPRPLSA